MILKSILFDLDGVIIDSEPVHAKATEQALLYFNIPFENDLFEKYKGRTDEDLFNHVFNYSDQKKMPIDVLIKKKNEFYSALAPELRLIDGFAKFHSAVKEKQFTTAIVTSSSLDDFRLVDDRFHFSRIFDGIITKEETRKHKPDPEPYLKALKKLRIHAESVWVIEDSFNGIISAKQAGCRTMALTTSFSKTFLQEAGPDHIFDSYQEINNFLGS